MNKYVQGNYPILSKKNLAKDMYELEIFCPEIVERAKPGQFVHIGVKGHTLRRPISICKIDHEKNTIFVVFQAKGSGTRDLAEMTNQNILDVLGPCGNGFPLLDPSEKVICIGGGIGVPPMVGVASHYGSNATAICGFRDKSLVILQDEFAKLGTNSVICSDDGSVGIHGLVTVPLEDMLAKEKPAVVYACGPIPMLRAIAGVAEKYDVPCKVSMEQHMGCGIGACLVCIVQIQTENGIEFKHVCKDGPVFDSKEVVF